MSLAADAFTVWDRADGLLHLRIALRGAPVVVLVRALAKLDGVRVTGGPTSTGAAAGFVVHCPGFKMLLSVPEDGVDFVSALVSRTPQATLAVMSELASHLERLMREPPRLPEPAPVESPVVTRSSLPLRRSTLKQGKPLARTSGLKRKTPLARSPFNRRGR
jgi:hypothetical protein